jgi:hypothetical protein
MLGINVVCAVDKLVVSPVRHPKNGGANWSAVSEYDLYLTDS